MGGVSALTLLTIVPLVAGGMCLTIGLIHLGLGLSHPRSQIHLAFSLTALMISAATLLQPWVHKASTVEELRVSFRWMIGYEALFWLAAVWFIVLYTGLSNRWLPSLITACFGVGLLFQIFSQGGILFREITAINQVTLIWGEVASLPVGPSSGWRFVTDVGLLGFFILGALGCRQLLQHRSKKHAAMMGVSLGVLLVGVIQGSLVDLGVLETPYLFSYGYIGFVLIMSWDLINDVVRVSALSLQVSAQEERWKTLCNRVRLAIVGLDPEGKVNFANPYFSELTGFDRQELLGRSWFEGFLVEPIREETSRVFKSREIPDHFQSSILTSSGGEKIVAWSNVTLVNSDGEFAGTLSIGADISDRIEAEEKLRTSIEELERLKDDLKEENISLLEEVSRGSGFPEIVGESPALKYVLQRVQEVAPTEANVLLEGETGVGKELMAQAIHARSERCGRPLLKVDCATLPPPLLESELFGHVKGAYTGADRARRGRFELADGGTIFLDEVGELPLEIQPKLLRVLQDGRFERLGSETTTEVDVRIIAATNRDLKQEVAESRFRGDLYFRLSVFPISVPPLRSRHGDIPLLLAHFVDGFAKKYGKAIETIPKGVLDQLN
ncbi:MAG TPA: sigma 54-interacting transcriptional regulator, partial [Acidobacteriota bacterium]|nr:sigma 54-interacting transcriptional regulator [Acidobacteriota bacterium]